MRAAFQRLKNLPILVVGDLLCDRYIYGNASRISREAPVQIVHTMQEEIRPGGAANVAMNLRPFGVKVWLMGVVGRDAYGTRLLSHLRRSGVSVAAVRSSTRPTSVKARVIAQQHQQVLRLDTETSAPPRPVARTCRQRPPPVRTGFAKRRASQRAKGCRLVDFCRGRRVRLHPFASARPNWTPNKPKSDASGPGEPLRRMAGAWANGPARASEAEATMRSAVSR